MENYDAGTSFSVNIVGRNEFGQKHFCPAKWFSVMVTREEQYGNLRCMAEGKSFVVRLLQVERNIWRAAFLCRDRELL